MCQDDCRLDESRRDDLLTRYSAMDCGTIPHRETAFSEDRLDFPLGSGIPVERETVPQRNISVARTTCPGWLPRI